MTATLAMMIGTARYRTSAVVFDGTNDFMLRGADLTGAADGKSGIFSAWVNFQGADATVAFLLANNGGFINIGKNASNKLLVQGFNSGATKILEFLSTTAYTSVSGWKHILAAWDLAAGTTQLYVNDADDRAGTPTATNDTIDYVNASPNWAVGAAVVGGTNKLFANVADFYVNLNSYVDISSTAIRRKFISASIKPVDLGPDGSAPTGTQPIVFFKGPAASFQTNLGSGGNFSVTGALTDATTSPSD